ncbi:MAG: ABC-2 family transporter protein [Elusimicrobiales bacterium]
MRHKKYLSISSTAISSHLRYLSPFLISRTFMILILLILYSLYSMILRNGGNFGGFTLLTLLYYLAVTNAIAAAGTSVFSEISEEIKDGSCAYNLLRPIHYVAYKYFNSLGPAVLNLSISLVLGILTFGFLAGYDLDIIRRIFIAFPMLLLSLTLSFSISLLIGLLAFFMEETAPLNWIYGKVQFLLGGAFIPLDMFPEWLESLVKHLPTAYIVYYPAKCAVSPWGINHLKVLAVQFIYAALLLTAGLLLFKKGIKEIQVNGG